MKQSLGIVAFAVLNEGEEPDLSRVAPAARRRLSPLQKAFFALASAAEQVPSTNTIFASQYGEVSLTRRLVEDFNAASAVSPNRFSTSVYNAAPGLWSVATRNKASYTAIAAQELTIESALLELAATPEPQLLVYAEEKGAPHGLAVLFGENASHEITLTKHALRATQTPISYAALRDFLSGNLPRLEGRFITLEDRAACV